MAPALATLAPFPVPSSPFLYLALSVSLFPSYQPHSELAWLATSGKRSPPKVFGGPTRLPVSVHARRALAAGVAEEGGKGRCC